MNKIKILMILSLLFCISKVLYASDESPYNEHTDNSTKITDPITETSNLLEAYVHLANLRNSGLDNIKSLYDEENEKALAYFKLSAFELAGISMFIDLADYQTAMDGQPKVTEEGDAGWVTVWIDASKGISVGLPFSTGITNIKMEDGIADPRRRLSFEALSASTPFMQVTGIGVGESGFYNDVSINFEGINLSFSWIDLKWNVSRFEIKKEYLDTIIKSIIKDGGMLGKNLDEDDITSIFSNFITNHFGFQRWLFIPDFKTVLDLNPIGNLRRFTNTDAAEAIVGGEFYHARGGYDINNDGIPNNVFPLTPNGSWWEPLIWEDFEITFKNSGTEIIDFFHVVVEDIPDGWRIDTQSLLNKDIFGQDVHSETFRNVPPSGINEFESSKWVVAATEEAPEEAKITFKLYEDRKSNAISKLVDSIEVTFIKHKDGDLFSPQLEFTVPDTPITVLQGEPIDISWNVVDPNENSYVALAFDQSLSNNPWDLNQSEWILPGIKEDGGNSTYSWNTTDISEGTYQIWGVVYDGATEPVYRTLQHHVTILEQVAPPQFTNGRVSPTVGSTNTKFEFSIDYQSDLDLVPDVVTLYVDNKTYEMNTNSTDFTGGVVYKKDVNDLSAGIHSYAFTAERAGESIGHTASDQVTVNEPSDGWDLTVASTTSFSPSKPNKGQKITVEAAIDNLSESGNVYTNEVISARLIGPNGSTTDQNTATITSISPGARQFHEIELNLPSNSTDGSYKIIVSVAPDLDENYDNNVRTLGFYIGDFLGYSKYNSIYGDLWVTPETNTNPDWINDIAVTHFSIFGTEFEVTGINSDNIVFRYNSNDIQVYVGQIKILPDVNGAIYVDITMSDATEQHGYIEVLEATELGPEFNPSNLVVSQGSIASMTISPPSGRSFNSVYNSDVIPANHNQSYNFEDWFTDSQGIGSGVYELEWSVPSNVNKGSYELYFRNEYSTGNPTFTNMYITVTGPLPEINFISSNQISYHDEIDITGTDFGSATGKVYFNELEGSVISWTNTKIVAEVPIGVQNGSLFVTSIEGVSNAVSYQVIISEPPIEPVISINDEELPYQIEEDGAGFNIGVENTGGGTLAWTATPSANWIDADVEVLDENTGSGTIHVYVHPYRGCGSFDRSGQIKISSSNASESPQIVEIYQTGFEYYSEAPDLIAKSVSGPAEVYLGENIPVQISYSNSGDEAAPSGWTGAIYLTSSNTELDGSEIEVFSFVEEKELCYEDPATEVEVNLAIPDTITAGTYYYALQLDVNDKVYEYEDLYPYDDINNNLVFSESVEVFATSPLKFEETIDPITLRAGDTRNQIAETYLHENIASLFGGGSGTVTYTASSSDPTLVEANIAEGNLSIGVVGAGTDEQVVTVTLTGTDENDNSADGTMEVTVHPAYGDPNADGRVNSLDAARVLQSVVELYTFNTLQQDVADIDRSGSINSYDATLILQYAVELIDRIPLGDPQAMMASSTVEGSSSSASEPVTWGEIQQDGQTLLLPVLLNTPGPVYSIDLSGTFEADAGMLEEISFPELPDGWMTAQRVDKDGELFIAMAGTEPFDGERVAVLRFTLNEFSQQIGVEGKGYLNNSSYTLEQVAVQEVIDQFALENNFPNPFNPSTNLRYQLPAPSDVRIEMYNTAGQRVMQVLDARQNSGTYTLNVDMSAFSSGVYFIRFVASSGQETYITTSKMTLIK